MSAAERMARYRWQGMAAAALEKAARLITERPPGKTLPPLPESLVRAYELDRRRYKQPV